MLSITNCVGKHIACTWASISERSSTAVEALRSVEIELHDDVSALSVLGDGPLDDGSVIPSCDVLPLSWIDDQGTSSSCSRKLFELPSDHSTKLRKTMTMQSRSHAANVSSNDMPLVHLESAGE